MMMAGKNYAIIAFFALALFLFIIRVNFNGVFVDEEYYISAGKFFMSGQHEIGNPLNIMFGSFFVPVMSYMADAAGGIIFARMVSAFFILGTLVLIYLTAQKIFKNKRISSVAFLISLFFSPLFFIGRFATYDAPAVFFASLAFFIIISAGESKKSRSLYFLASLIFFLSFISKYTSIILVLPLAIIAVREKRKDAAYFILPYIALILLYTGLFSKELAALASTKLAEQASSFLPDFIVIALLVPYIALSLVSPKNKWIIFMPAVFLVILLQSFITNSMNDFKHASFALIFIAPFAAYGLCKIRPRMLIVPAVVLAAIFWCPRHS